MIDVWTNARVEELKALYTDPGVRWSASQIAAKMGNGITRNAIIGKVHRLGLERRGKKVGATKGPTLKRSPNGIGAAVQKINRTTNAGPELKPEPFIIACDEVAPLNLTMADLQEGDCRFPYGDEPASVTFCGHPAITGHSWCKGHCKVVFQPRPQRKPTVNPAEFGQHRGGVFGRCA